MSSHIFFSLNEWSHSLITMGRKILLFIHSPQGVVLLCIAISLDTEVFELCEGNTVY